MTVASEKLKLVAPAVERPLDHLRMLEAESIHIMREVVAEFERPVMLYSIGKDSSCLLRLAQKAFYPAPIPFPLLHVDTTYKFRELIDFRDAYTKELGVRLIVHTNTLIMLEQPFVPMMPGEKPQMIKCRMRSLGCSPCTGAVRSDADTVQKIIDELIVTKHSERQLRVIDHDQDGSMEVKKREGYF